MMIAAMMGAMSFQKGLGAVHAISHPLGGMQEPRLHHGTLNAVVMPAVLRFNAGHVGDKYSRLKDAMEPCRCRLSFITNFNAKLGLPANLRDMGVPDSVIPAMSAAAELDHCNATNPRPATKDDYEALIDRSMGCRTAERPCSRFVIGAVSCSQVLAQIGTFSVPAWHYS